MLGLQTTKEEGDYLHLSSIDFNSNGNSVMSKDLNVHDVSTKTSHVTILVKNLVH